MRGRPALQALASTLVVLGGCRPSPAPEETAPQVGKVPAISYQDLTIERRDEDLAPLRRSAIRLCGDESYLALELRGGESRAFEVELAEPGTLLVGGCVDSKGLEPGQGLRVVLGGRGARRKLGTFRFEDGWSTEQLELQPRGGPRIKLRLIADVPGDARILIRDLSLRTERGDPPPAPAKRALLISLDAFREDVVGAIGGRTRTPNLNRLLAESERFFPHWAAEISTKPSHASMLTGLPVVVHGCDRTDAPLGDEIDTVAERIGRTGAATAAFASIAPYFHRRFGLSQGFDEYAPLPWSAPQELRAATSWVTEHRDEPWFLFVHLYDAHSDFQRLPYEAAGVSRETIEEFFGVRDYGCREGRCASALLLSMNLAGRRPIAREAEILRFLYERSVESLDRALGDFFDQLRRSGLWDDTLVIVTADHGEQFGEHGFFLHTTAHEETLRVPLIVKWPGKERAGRLTRFPSTSLDLAPTLLAHFGLAAEDLVGRNLAGPTPGGRTLMVSKDAVRLDRWKLLLATEQYPEALYDLEKDPRERFDRLAEFPAVATRLREIWKQAHERASERLGKTVSAEPQPFTDEEVEQLRSLGYLQ